MKRVMLLTILVFFAYYGSTTRGAEMRTLRDLEAGDSREIKGAAVSNASDAQQRAFKGYAEKMKLAIAASEAPGSPSIVTLGLNIPGFGSTGDKIWEVRISSACPDGSRCLRAVVWVNAETEKLYFVIGPWEFEKEKGKS